VFLRVGGQFLVVCCGMNLQYLELTMTVLLLAVMIYTIMGGMLSVLVTDFLQFVVMSAGLLVITFLVLGRLGWGTLTETVSAHYGAGGFNPFVAKGLGWPFVVSNLLTNTAAVLTWQAVTARLLASKDSNTGRKIFQGTAFFFVSRWMIPGIWGIAALATVTPDVVTRIGLQLGESDGSLFAMPYLLSQIVPVGLMGLLVAAMIAADMSTDSSYMLTWGSVIYNDILAPLRRKTPWSEKKGILWNRCIIGVIGVYLLFWGLWYRLEGNLWEYCQTTGTIYLASMSILLIGSVYWKRANNWGAIAAIVVGAVLPVLSLTLNLFVTVQVPVLDASGLQIMEDGQAITQTMGWARHRVGDNFVNIGTYVLVAVAMIVGSLLKPASQRPAKGGSPA
jgi:SSS family solute:Na+ symporter